MLSRLMPLLGCRTALMLCRAIIMAMTVVLGCLWRALGLDVKGPGQADDGLGHLPHLHPESDTRH